MCVGKTPPVQYLEPRWTVSSSRRMVAALLRRMRMGEVPGGIGRGRSSTVEFPVGWGMSNIGTALARSAGRFRGANPTTRKQAAGRPRKRYVLSESKEKCAAHYKRFQAEHARFFGKKPNLRIRCLYSAGPQENVSRPGCRHILTLPPGFSEGRDVRQRIPTSDKRPSRARCQRSRAALPVAGCP